MKKSPDPSPSCSACLLNEFEMSQTEIKKMLNYFPKIKEVFEKNFFKIETENSFILTNSKNEPEWISSLYIQVNKKNRQRGYGENHYLESLGCSPLHAFLSFVQKIRRGGEFTTTIPHNQSEVWKCFMDEEEKITLERLGVNT